MRTFRVSALNITMPLPHSPQRYVELFKTAYAQRRIVKLRGDYAGMLGGLALDKDVVRGQFYKFFDLNLEADWFDLSKKQEADPEELAEIQVPPHLKPHHQSVDFVLFPQRHRLVFVARDGKEVLSPNMAKSLIERLFEDERLVERFGPVEITIEPKREQLRRILALPRLKKLSIQVLPPNPDDLDDAEQEVLDRMSQERAHRMTIELTSRHPNGLEPDNDHKVLARVAQSNGKVSAVGEDETGKVLNVSTSDHPYVEAVTYDPNVQSRNHALEVKGRSVMQALRG
jgi:hypothetical protein